MGLIDLNMMELPSGDELKRFQQLSKKNTYIKAPWKTTSKVTLNLYKQICPALKYVTGNPRIVQKMSEKGDLFLKVEVPLADGCSMEFDISYAYNKKDNPCPFNIGDEFDLNTVMFCIEDKIGREGHLYITGEVVKK
jgi:hypothetical protein